MNEKTCKTCDAVKPLSDFYKCKNMGDGHFSDCKLCYTAKVLKYRSANIDKVREYDRERGKTKKRKTSTAENTKNRRARDPRYAKCHSAVARAIRNGVIVKSPCIRCGATKAMAHHDSYDKPLEVVFLCQPCHKIRHKELDDLGLKP